MSEGRQTLESMKSAKKYNHWLLKKFSKYLKGDILEVGSGIGNFTQILAGYGNVTAVDIDKSYVEETKKLLGDKASVGIGDIEKGKFFFKDKKFDVILCINVLEHIKDDNKSLMNINRLLKPKGYLVLMVPGHQSLYGEIDKSIDHFRRYNKKNLIRLFQKNSFKIISSRKLNFIGAVGWYIAGKILKRKIVETGKVKMFNLISPLFLWTERFLEPVIGISLLVIGRKQ